MRIWPTSESRSTALLPGRDRNVSRASHGTAARLAAGLTIAEPVTAVVAHPDDETLGLGARLTHLQELELIHLTDGAPRDMEDAARERFATTREYACARGRELEEALHALSAAPVCALACDYPDKELVNHLLPLTLWLADRLAEARVVVTHPYEHGHPDHDSTALAVHAACALLRRKNGGAPAVVEFPSYHMRESRMIFGRFWPDERCREWVAVLNEQERIGKARAVSCFHTQRAVLQAFSLDVERYRAAPAYDFRKPAPPGAAVYDLFGWHVTSSIWRQRAAAVLDELDFEGTL